MIIFVIAPHRQGLVRFRLYDQKLVELDKSVGGLIKTVPKAFDFVDVVMGRCTELESTAAQMQQKHAELSVTIA